MAQQLRVGDENSMMHDYTFAAAGTGAIAATNVGTSIDLGAADVDEESPGEICVELGGITSGGSATIAVSVLDSADDSSFAVLTPTGVDIDTGDVDFDDAVWDENGGTLRLPLPAYGLRRYIHVLLTIKVATITGGPARIYFQRTPK